jgi:hypothetical protein
MMTLALLKSYELGLKEGFVDLKGIFAKNGPCQVSIYAELNGEINKN